MGVPITTVMLRRRGRVRLPRACPDDYYLPDLDLTADETRCAPGRGERHLARQPVRRGRAHEARRARVGARGADRVPPDRARARDVVRGVPPPRCRHVRAPRPTRTVEPWGLSSKRGHWYVVGWDRDRDAVRAFRADRIEGDVKVGHDRRVRRPPTDSGPTITSRTGPGCSATNAPVTVELRVDAAHAASALAELRGDGQRRDTTTDGTGRRRADHHEPRRVPLLRPRLHRSRRSRRPARRPRRHRSRGWNERGAR